MSDDVWRAFVTSEMERLDAESAMITAQIRGTIIGVIAALPLVIWAAAIIGGYIP